MATAPSALSAPRSNLSGSTSLLQVGHDYDLENISSGTGPELQRGGAAVTVGEYAGWTLIGAEQVAGGGYDVAWENASTGQYSVWNTNSNGNYLSNLITHVAGNNIALESLENTFHQDLNGDGTIGLVGTAIELSGSTSLLQVGHDYDLENISSGTGPELQRGGAAVTVGEYAGWALIGAEQVAGGGYDVALKNASTGQYSVWSTNSNGNYLSNLITHVAGNSIALESPGEHLPPGPQWRRHHRPCRHRDRIVRLDQPASGRPRLRSRKHQQRHRPRIATWRRGRNGR